MREVGLQQSPVVVTAIVQGEGQKWNAGLSTYLSAPGTELLVC